MKNLNKWGLAKQAMKIGMFFSVVFAAIQGYKIWTYFKKFPETYFEYQVGFTPDELVIKTQMMNTGISLVWLGLFFWLLLEITSYLEKPEKHWLTWLNNKFKISKKLEKLGDKLEDE